MNKARSFSFLIIHTGRLAFRILLPETSLTGWGKATDSPEASPNGGEGPPLASILRLPSSPGLHKASVELDTLPGKSVQGGAVPALL